jgi:4-amino-4-deoxy-L-arabinose transferase-like glycosyltransferase
MVFRFYTNTISRASKSFAAGIFIIGMVIIGFGFLIYLLPKLFATLASIVFWVIGIGCIVTAVKIFLITKNNDDSDSSGGYRENVHIHIEEHRDQ